jgi:hypothetical protein
MSCSSRAGSGPAASRHVASTVSVGTANGTCQGSSGRSPNSAARISPYPASGIRAISSTARSAAAIVIDRRAVPLTFPRGTTCAATSSITPGRPVMASSCCSMTPSRAWSAGCPPAWTRPSRRTTAGATATGLRNTTISPARIFPAPSAVSAVRSPSRSGRSTGEARSATRTATIPAPARPAGHPSGTAAAVAGNGTAGYKDTRDSGDQKGRQQPLLLLGVPPESM